MEQNVIKQGQNDNLVVQLDSCLDNVQDEDDILYKKVGNSLKTINIMKLI
jgi:hypothetical protein